MSDNSLFILRKPNFIIERSQNLDLIEHKFYNIFLLELQKIKWNNNIVKVPLVSLFEVIGSGIQQSQSLIKKSINGLQTKSIEFIKTNLLANSKESCFIASFEVIDDYVEIEFSIKLMDALNLDKEKNLSNGFTKNNLLITSRFKSKHTCAVYEYIAMLYCQMEYAKNKQKRPQKQINITVEKYREITNTVDKYSSFQNLYKRSIKVVEQEINNSADFDVKIELVKYKNTIQSINFYLVKEKECKNIVQKISDIQDNNSYEIIKTIDNSYPKPIQTILGWGYKNKDLLLEYWDSSDINRRQQILDNMNETIKNKPESNGAYFTSLMKKNANYKGFLEVQNTIKDEIILPVEQVLEPKTQDPKASYIYQNDKYAGIHKNNCENSLGQKYQTAQEYSESTKPTEEDKANFESLKEQVKNRWEVLAENEKIDVLNSLAKGENMPKSIITLAKQAIEHKKLDFNYLSSNVQFFGFFSNRVNVKTDKLKEVCTNSLLQNPNKAAAKPMLELIEGGLRDLNCGTWTGELAL